MALDDARKRLDMLEIMPMAQVYVPEVRWNLLKVANWISLHSYSTCVKALIDVVFVIVDVNYYCRNDYRHLIEQRWLHGEGALDLLVCSSIRYVLSLTLLNMSLPDAGHCCLSKEKDRADQSGRFLGELNGKCACRGCRPSWH